MHGPDEILLPVYVFTSVLVLIALKRDFQSKKSTEIILEFIPIKVKRHPKSKDNKAAGKSNVSIG
jgi:hypothetical protein